MIIGWDLCFDGINIYDMNDCRENTSIGNIAFSGSCVYICVCVQNKYVLGLGNWQGT